ncbi:prephenate dehydrogenase [Aquimarina sp. MMG015]|uniref:prephenate dehydrogenase n=1 Tax=unclassified Aquimarina TaxID=2627091 RepID=UPI000E48CBA8|nr:MULTISPECIES: prephenate dehydrogenase [unclassified Aquimarina]AXT58059.1 prephenate dehydrogenase [Aquimarina sp. AD1]MBQ4803042.1 prephenate dehydrogenase [Aquimarina sp. MMG015]RKN25615.1 prephenate dehydrogenase [Aquimarina sp. AD1]
MKVFIIGIGLIGGSFAIDVKAAFNEAKIYGIDKNEEHLDKAISLGLIDEKANFSALEKADVVITSIPVDVTVKLLPEILDIIHDDCLVFDVGSTKKKLCNSVSDHPKRRNYLAAHPIAGTEFSGPQAAIANLYRGKTNIICEVEKTAFKLQERGMEIFTRLGMRIRYMDPASHDKHIAYVSHLSHISSFMLGKTVIEKEKNERDIFDMAGSGFASTVRLAKSSPEMWAPIFKHNKENVVETLTEYIANLTQFKELMEEDNFVEIYKEMEDTNHIRTILKGIS